jgi:hypothetical protein
MALKRPPAATADDTATAKAATNAATAADRAASGTGE